MERRNILVTGATSGIGECTVRYLISEGYAVVAVGRNQEKLKQLEEESEHIYSFAYDLSDLENIEEIFKFCQSKGILLNGMVHSAGIGKDMLVRENDIEKLKEIMTINYMSFVELGKHFSKRQYSAKESSIVAISSEAVRNEAAAMNAYASSKAALNCSVGVMAKEFVKRKIRVNAVMPTYVDTPMVTTKEGEYRYQKAIEKMPFGIIEPIQVAYLIEFLLSQKSKYITGQKFCISQ